MANSSIRKGRIIQKIDTYDNWVSNNPVLLKGELAIDSTNKQIKIGDGTTGWKDLPYMATTYNTDINELTARVVDLEEFQDTQEKAYNPYIQGNTNQIINIYSKLNSLDAEYVDRDTTNFSIGEGSHADNNDIAIGINAQTTTDNGDCSIAIGTGANVVAQYGDAVQLLGGTNTDEHTLQFKDYQVVGYDSDNEENYLTDVGLLSDLHTTATDNIVSATNELYETQEKLEETLEETIETLEDKVSFTDYPALYFNESTFNIEDKAGVVKVKSDYTGGCKIDGNGYLQLFPAPEVFIDGREGVHPITPTNLDYAVRSVTPKVLDKYDLDKNGDFTVREDLSGAIYNLKVNNIYDWQNSTPDIKLPKGYLGDFIQFDFWSGETPATLTIDATSTCVSDIDLIPEANTMYSLYFDYGTIHFYTNELGDYVWDYGWRFSYAAYPYNTEV